MYQTTDVKSIEEKSPGSVCVAGTFVRVARKARNETQRKSSLTLNACHQRPVILSEDYSSRKARRITAVEGSLPPSRTSAPSGEFSRQISCSPPMRSTNATGAALPLRRHKPNHPIRPLNEVLHVRQVRMPAVMLPPRQLPIHQSLAHRRHLRRPVIPSHVQALCPKQPKHTASVNGSHKAAELIKPLRIARLRNSITNKRQPWRAQRDQFIRIDGNVSRRLTPKRRLRRAVLHEVPGHPVIFAAGQILDGLAEIPPQQSRSAFSRRSHQHHRKALIHRHCQKCGLAEARHTFNADMFRIHRGISFQIIQSPTCTPSPSPQRAPIFRLARLSFIHQPNNPACDSVSVIRLHTRRIEHRKSPASANELPRRRWVTILRQLRKLKRSRFHRFPRRMRRKNPFQRWILLYQHGLPRLVDALKLFCRRLMWSRKSRSSEHHEHGHWSLRVRRSHQRHVHLHADRRI